MPQLNIQFESNENIAKNLESRFLEFKYIQISISALSVSNPTFVSHLPVARIQWKL